MSTTKAKVRLPEGNQLTARDENYRNNFHDVIDLLREHSPVVTVATT